jgi:hypothetical protein
VSAGVRTVSCCCRQSAVVDHHAWGLDEAPGLGRFGRARVEIGRLHSMPIHIRVAGRPPARALGLF